MEFIREIKKIETNTITIDLPQEYRDQEVEILVLPLKKELKEKTIRSTSFKSFDEISIDTRNFKFNREELHGR